MPISVDSGASNTPVDYAYLGFGTNVNLSAEVDYYTFYGRNLIKNSPGQIVTDGAEPQWWDDVANATITDEDAAGEACSDLFERVFKVVTTADDVYGYQTCTFADEELLDAGATTVSLGVWVWCDAASTASVAIYGTNLGLQESDQHTGGSGWELLTVEAQVLNAADTAIEVRLIVDTDTAFFAAPMLCVGPKALPWNARGLKFIPQQSATQIDTTTGDVAWSDTDCTANTDPLAVAIQGRMYILEINGTAGSAFYIGHDSAVIGADSAMCGVVEIVINIQNNLSVNFVILDDQQVCRYTVVEADADNDVSYKLFITGYWMWG